MALPTIVTATREMDFGRAVADAIAAKAVQLRLVLPAELASRLPDALSAGFLMDEVGPDHADKEY